MTHAARRALALLPLALALLPLALALLPLAPGAASGQAPDLGERARAACHETIADYFHRQHMDPARIDRDAVCARYAEQALSGIPPSVLRAWLLQRMREVEFDWARPGARHRPGTRYQWPYTAWIPRLLSQASGGATHNTPEEFHAFDFLMPSGTPVLAARDGRVAEVRDGTGEDVSWEEDNGNTVYVLHEDGTFAMYAHLQRGIPVEVGQEVRVGEPIARSGNTGYSFTPHLHFVVQRLEAPGELRSVPIRFGQPGRPGLVPEAGRHWGAVPRSRRTLRVFAGDRELGGEEPLVVGYGSELRLRAELVGPRGVARDVTSDERTRYETMTVWNLHAAERGRLVVDAVPGIDRKYIERTLPLLDQSRAVLFVYHGEPGDPDFGMAQLVFQVQVPATAP